MGGRTYAIFSAQYPPHLGGIENFTRSVAQALVSRDNRVTVVTNDTEGLGAGVDWDEGVEVVRLPCVPLVSGRLPLPVYSGEGRRLREELEGRHFDGVLVNARFYPHSLYGMRFARSKGLRPVVLDHGSAYLSFSNPVLDPIVRLYERGITSWGGRYKAAYYGISQKSAEWLGTFGITARGVIPNAIDAARYHSCASSRNYREELGLDASSFMVAFVGRLIPEKGVAQIIEASQASELRERGVTFVIAGDGPLASVVNAAEGDGLRWMGRLSREDTAALLSQANVMCLPTRSEGFSTTLLEASACGCPSVVTDVGGARELMPGDRFGTIVPSQDVEGIVSALVRLFDNPDVLKEQARLCASIVESQYSWDSTAAAVERALTNDWSEQDAHS